MPWRSYLKKKDSHRFFACVSILTKNRFSRKRLQRGTHNIYICWKRIYFVFFVHVSILRIYFSKLHFLRNLYLNVSSFGYTYLFVCCIYFEYLFLAKRIYFCLSVSIFVNISILRPTVWRKLKEKGANKNRY